MQVPHELSLTDLVRWYEEMLQSTELLSSDPSLKSRIEKIVRIQKNHIDSILAPSRSLQQELNDYFSDPANRPFEWNRNSSKNGSNEEKDWEQHDHLTICAMLLGDTKLGEELILKWGINYPMDNGPGLSQPNQKYIETLKRGMAYSQSAKQTYYYQFLIDNLSPMLD